MKLAEVAYLIIFLFITSLFLTGIHGKSPFYISNMCFPAAGNYTLNSFYQKNLNSVLSDLSSQSSSLSFSTSSTGTAPNDVYGLFFCRYDLPSSDCSACVQDAVGKLTSNCTQEKDAIAYYEQCTLRYANHNIFSLEEDRTGTRYYSPSNVSMDTTEFNTAFSIALDGLINQTAYNTSSPKYFKTLVTNISLWNTLYILVQCTPDITPSSCDRCLRTIGRNLPKGSIWVMFFLPSCQMRYDLVPFFDLPTPPPSPSPWSAPSSTSSGKGGAMYYVIRAVIPVGAVGLFLLVGIIICLIRQTRDSSPGLPKTQPAVVVDPPQIGGGGEVQTSDQCVQFEFRMLDTATNNFSQANKLGQGGFGIVYSVN